MDKQELEQEVIKLRMQLMLVASQQKRTKVANKDQHDKVPKETADIAVLSHVFVLPGAQSSRIVTRICAPGTQSSRIVSTIQR
jgi:hypothetical protein